MPSAGPLLAPLRRNRDFMLLMSGTSQLSCRNEHDDFGLILLGYAVTESAALAGAVGAVYGVGMATMMLPAGAIVDRLNSQGDYGRDGGGGGGCGDG